MPTKLIIIHGVPGVGKSTLAMKLAHDLQLPILTKDTFKELLFDTLGSQTRDDSRFLGKVAVKMLYAATAEFMAAERSVIIENAFYAAVSRFELTPIIDKYKPETVEIYCHTSEEIRHARFSQRLADGSRHSGHHDSTQMLDVDLETYAVLAISPVIYFDTSTSDEAVYQELLSQLTS